MAPGTDYEGGGGAIAVGGGATLTVSGGTVFRENTAQGYAYHYGGAINAKPVSPSLTSRHLRPMMHHSRHSPLDACDLYQFVEKREMPG